ncbi:Uncharacterised protein [Metamycoplasma arthritidis]|nr:Uncharacterised protein [Metamycoplasma arthritidis]
MLKKEALLIDEFYPKIDTKKHSDEIQRKCDELIIKLDNLRSRLEDLLKNYELNNDDYKRDLLRWFQEKHKHLSETINKKRTWTDYWNYW